jgi:hypothetical protein
MRKLGKTQRLVLENVRAGRWPYAGHRDYAEYSRRDAVAHQLMKRGLLKLLPPGHPLILEHQGNPWLLTPEGAVVLESA